MFPGKCRGQKVQENKKDERESKKHGWQSTFPSNKGFRKVWSGTTLTPQWTFQCARHGLTISALLWIQGWLLPALSKDFSIKDITPLCLRFGRKLCFSTYSMDWPEEGRTGRTGFVCVVGGQEEVNVNIFLFLSTLFLRWCLLLNLHNAILELAARPWIIQVSHRTAWAFKQPMSE